MSTNSGVAAIDYEESGAYYVGTQQVFLYLSHKMKPLSSNVGIVCCGFI